MTVASAPSAGRSIRPTPSVDIIGTNTNTIGFVTGMVGNVISGNTKAGVRITRDTSRNDADATGNLVQGNFIGTDVTGTQPLGNGARGVFILGADHNTVGGNGPEFRNIISANNLSTEGLTGGTNVDIESFVDSVSAKTFYPDENSSGATTSAPI